MRTPVRLSDETISEIARLVQLAILTGTDVVDNLRTLSLAIDETACVAYPHPDFTKNMENAIAKLLESVNEQPQNFHN